MRPKFSIVEQHSLSDKNFVPMLNQEIDGIAKCREHSMRRKKLLATDDLLNLDS